MRIIGRVCGVENPRGFQVEVDETEDVAFLKSIFANRTGIEAQFQILSTVRDGHYIRVTEGWPISFFIFYESQLVNIHDFRSEHFQFHEKTCLHKRKVLGGAGGVSSPSKASITTAESDMPYIRKQSQQLAQMLAYSSQLSLTDAKSDEVHTAYSWAQFRELQTILIKNIKSKRWKDVKSVIDQHEQLLIKSKQRDQQVDFNLLSDLDEYGWNPMHYAVFAEVDEISRKLIHEANGIDINKTTRDDWTLLQLAVFRNNLKLVKIIAEADDIIIDLHTSRGSALHLASAKGYIKIVQYLVLEKNANPDLKEAVEGKSPFGVATKLVRFFFRQHKRIKMLDIQSAIDYLENRKSFYNDMPKKPHIIRGMVKRQHSLFPCLLQNRFMEINSNTCLLVFYENEENVPQKPKEMINLIDILDVDILPRHWPMQSELIYVRIIYQSSAVLGFRTKDAAEHWILKLNDAISYANYVDKKMRSFVREKETSQQKQEQSNHLQFEEKQMFTMSMQLEENRILTIRDEVADCQVCEEKLNEPAANLSEKGMNFQEILVHHVKKSFAVEINHYSLGFVDFSILAVLGQGSFGRVFLVQENSSGNLFAMKMLKKISLIIKYQLKYAVIECNVLKRAKHPFIISLHYAFQTPNNLYMVLDYCSGGSLLHHIQREKFFNEQSARLFLCEIILAIEYLHSIDVLYRDLKPENILVGADGHLSITDFGLAKENANERSLTKSFCGSPAYLSPEMLKGKGFTKASDVYGVGCVFFEMLTGQPPFYDNNVKKIYEGIKSQEPTYPKHLSQNAKSLLQGLLKKHPKERLGSKSIAELKQHEFFEGIDWHRVYEKKYPPPQFVFNHMLRLSTDKKEKLQKKYSDEDYTNQNQKINRVKNWSFVGRQRINE